MLVLPSNAPACGPWLPDRLLGDGGSSINTAPEFFFELEMKRIAEAYPSRFKMVHPPKADQGGFDYAKQTSEADLADFDAALKSGSIQATDPAKAREQHQIVRNYLDDKTAGKGAPPVEDFVSEFSQYDKAAAAYEQNDSKTARELWLALLALPADQRHYRSTWAAYMLGQDALQNKNYDQAIQYFQQTRSLAEQGFADSPGLAAASIGWEALALLNKDQLAKSATLYLQSVNSGEFNNIYSLATIARQVFGISSQSTDQMEPDAESTATPSPTTQSTPVRLPDRSAEAARDPVLRQLVSAALLAGVLEDYSASDTGENGKVESWLKTLERLNLAKVESAEVLGWLAYSNGKFEEATRWLKRADPNLPLSHWLQAKLDFHAGKLDQAIAELGAAVKTFPAVTQLESRELDGDAEALPDPHGDLGALLVARADFLNAFHTLLQGNNWQDAAYLAERVLTLSELQKLVDSEFPAKPDDDSRFADVKQVTSLESELGDAHYGAQDRMNADQKRLALRWLLARRLVRSGRFAEAKPYFLPPLRETLAKFIQLSEQAKTTSDSKARAEVLWSLAQFVRTEGMELMGTEVEPDGFLWGGDFAVEDVATARLKGRYIPETEQGLDPAKAMTKPLIIPASASEKSALKLTFPKPNQRFHYRFIAADYAWDAAKLMPDNQEETAKVLLTAASWIKDRDDKAADRFYEALVTRCANTNLGRAAKKRHWLPDLPAASPSPSPSEE
jgi:hypothetical protein